MEFFAPVPIPKRKWWGTTLYTKSMAFLKTNKNDSSYDIRVLISVSQGVFM